MLIMGLFHNAGYLDRVANELHLNMSTSLLRAVSQVSSQLYCPIFVFS